MSFGLSRQTPRQTCRTLLAAPGLALLGLLTGTPAAAVSLSLPATAIQAETVQDPAAPYAVAIGPVRAGTGPLITLDGARQRTAWHIPLADPSAAGLLAGLRDQLIADGFEVLYTCAAAACGGFDFRFSRPVLPMPAMFVDLGDFSYLSARRPTEQATPDTLISLLVSRGTDMLYLQVTEIRAVAPPPPGITPQSVPTPEQVVAGDWTAARIATQFAASGQVALDGISFQTGSSRLDETSIAPLKALADYLEANPGDSIILVGHSDWTGGLDSNIALSRARAQAVDTYLTTQFGIAANRISVQGIGYLAPRTTNTTPAGRDTNRRVEAVLLPATN